MIVAQARESRQPHTRVIGAVRVFDDDRGDVRQRIGAVVSLTGEPQVVGSRLRGRPGRRQGANQDLGCYEVGRP